MKDKKIITIKVYFYLLFFIIFSCGAYSYNFSYNLNKSSLPFTTKENIILNYPDNLNLSNNLSIVYSQFLSGNSFVTLINYTYNLTVNVLILSNQQPDAYVSVVNLFFHNGTSDYSYIYTSNITFFFNVSNNTNILNNTNISFVSNLTPYFFIDFNNFGYEICDYSITRQSYKTFFKTTVSSNPNSTLRVVCPNNYFVKCPNSILANFTVTDITFDIEIPINTSVGSYKETINFYQDYIFYQNYTYSYSVPIGSNITLLYNIRDCNIPLTEISSCQEIKCDAKNIDDFLGCIAKLTQCYNDVYMALLEANKTRMINQTNNITQYINKTYTVVAYDENLTSLLQQQHDLSITINKMIVEDRLKQTKIDELEGKVSGLQLDKENIQSQIPIIASQIVTELTNHNKNLTLELQKTKSSYIPKFQFYYLFAFFVMIIFGFYCYKYYKLCYPY